MPPNAPKVIKNYKKQSRRVNLIEVAKFLRWGPKGSAADKYFGDMIEIPGQWYFWLIFIRCWSHPRGRHFTCFALLHNRFVHYFTLIFILFFFTGNINILKYVLIFMMKILFALHSYFLPGVVLFIKNPRQQFSPMNTKP